ncbi:murein L,D-transpeptidase catalytic domain family protein [Legionella feeleii]|uniref:Murein L,D-transpeptidase catalytic domain family protein n=1 Tax=Legionella feeleii TaxID=453 RepID=A0A0W0U1P9_9GAMM|nr:murein L,D-transpeptidase catalytic domain family protein [Legionella feeleii]KTD01533.1 hypothetical protein Lfee_1137 [Legionella feeleii]SPX59336.1 Uncharacterised protein [Legionella feeleii]
MRKKLLLLFAVTTTCFSLPTSNLPLSNDLINRNNVIEGIMTLVSNKYVPRATIKSFNETKIEEMLRKKAPNLNTMVIDKVLATLTCAKEYNVAHNNILTIIDYSLPSSEKRLWVFDLNSEELLFYTYVSHGIKSGTLLSNYFSNKYDSKASSIGVYTTDQAYYGREGLSLRLDGLDRGFNDNASNRSIVMHGGWYMDENFIKKYGRAGRSWGCPALPVHLTTPIINTIKDNSLFVIYYPSDDWFLKSKFLNCHHFSPLQSSYKFESEEKPPTEQREAVLFAGLSKNNEAIAVMAADHYERIFHTKPPLERMLRRQIENMEYIALSNTEFKNLVSSNDKDSLSFIYFVVPEVKMQRGYYVTEMKIVPLGRIKEVRPHIDSTNITEPVKNYTVDFEEKSSVHLRTTDQFIRWLGL